MVRIPTTSVSFGSSSKKHFWTAPSMKKCSACEGTARTAARNTDDRHMVRGGVRECCGVRCDMLESRNRVAK